MTRDELKELACLGFSADLVMQSFCHTAAYPEPVDIETQHQLPDFIRNRAGVSLRPGDRLFTHGSTECCFPILLVRAETLIQDSQSALASQPDQASWPSRLHWVLCHSTCPSQFSSGSQVKCNHGITLRDIVNAIPYAAIQRGLLR